MDNQPARSSAAPVGQIRSLQALRAIAALFVVVFHSTVLWHDKFDAGVRPWANGNAGVDLFFVISGFIMVLSSQRLIGLADGWRRFLSLRLIRIVPMYWIVTGAKLVAISAVPSMALHTRPTRWNVLASFLFVPSRDASGSIRPILDVGWTLSFEMLFYAAFSASLFMGVRAGAVVIPGMAVLAIASLFTQPQWTAITSLADPIVLEFVFGLIVGTAVLGRRYPLGNAGWFALLALGMTGLAVIPTHGRWERVLVWGTAATCVIYASVATEQWTRRWIPNVLVGIGEASYSLYLTHAFVLPVVGMIAFRSKLTGDVLGAFLVLASVTISVAVSLVVYSFVEMPVTRWLRAATQSRAAHA